MNPHPQSVTLRPVASPDIDVFFVHQQDTVSNDLAKVYPRDRDAFGEHWQRIMDDPEVIARAIVIAGGMGEGDADAQVVGLINTFPIEDERHVGYWIDRAHWRKGIATRAVAMMVGIDGARPLHAIVASENIGSMRALERAGFVKTGQREGAGTDRYMACVEFKYELR